MKIRLAKTAGFCFGVDRAVKLTYGLLDEGRKVATLGPLIHNPQTVEDLERRGALVADTPADVPTGYEVVIRSHGVPRSIYDELDARGCTYHDATCPFVKRYRKSLPRPKPPVRHSWWPVTRPIRRCRASSDIPGERYSFSAIWPS